MVFASPIFLFLFLPAVLLGSLVLPARAQNAWLLAASLLFYVWGEVSWAWVILVSIAANYAFGIWLAGASRKRGVLILAVGANLGLLAVFKYADFVVENVNAVARFLGRESALLARPGVHLPIGISFFTFHALSYVVDVYRGRVAPQRRPVDFALYIAMFPQLIAGPIIRYKDIGDQLAHHPRTEADFAIGVRRFVVGLSKKVLIANTVAGSADAIFALPAPNLTPQLAWVGAALYMLQIYFDFSAYSDMAIGLGRMFGFRFLENFEHPYAALSVTEFWRRWHISLSNWLRDYLYIPLGGNRTGAVRTYVNLLVVFVLCGLWHGASYGFLVWGLYHGAFLVAERAGLARVLERLPRAARNLYLVVAVLVGWVFFRADTLGQAWAHLAAMLGAGESTSAFVTVRELVGTDVLLAASVGMVGSAPVVPWAGARLERVSPVALRAAATLVLAFTFLLSSALLASGTYNPFIYFRF